MRLVLSNLQKVENKNWKNIQWCYVCGKCISSSLKYACGAIFGQNRLAKIGQSGSTNKWGLYFCLLYDTTLSPTMIWITLMRVIFVLMRIAIDAIFEIWKQHYVFISVGRDSWLPDSVIRIFSQIWLTHRWLESFGQYHQPHPSFSIFHASAICSTETRPLPQRLKSIGI